MVKKVLVAMSGGVDSSVAAFLLKKKGFEIVGVTMCLGVKAVLKKSLCCGDKALEDAKTVCYKLKVPHYVLDFSRELEDKVIKNFIKEYLKGRTPNPCVNCNKLMKFGFLLKKALSLGFDYVATGHYAKIDNFKGEYFLKRPKDKIKDQTYFLSQIERKCLKHILFPLSGLTKKEVRKIAKDAKLPVFNKPQSYDICFIPSGNRGKFIKERIKDVKTGPIIDLKGNILGRHKGIIYYTVGQRQGLGISHKRPLYVVSIDAKENKIVVGEKDSLLSRGLEAGNLNMLVKEIPDKFYAQIRYLHKEAESKGSFKDNNFKIVFSEPQEAVTPGQSVVLYKDDTVLGGGVIERPIYECD